MDSNLTAGTRDLALSGSFVVPVAVVRPRVEQGKPVAGYGWQHGCPTAHLAGAGTTVLIGTDVLVIDRMRMSAAEP